MTIVVKIPFVTRCLLTTISGSFEISPCLIYAYAYLALSYVLHGFLHGNHILTNPRTGFLGNTGSSGRGVLVFDENVLQSNFHVLNFLVYDTVFGTLALIIPVSYFLALCFRS